MYMCTHTHTQRLIYAISSAIYHHSDVANADRHQQLSLGKLYCVLHHEVSGLGVFEKGEISYIEHMSDLTGLKHETQCNECQICVFYYLTDTQIV
jgi:hypothetical protein